MTPPPTRETSLKATLDAGRRALVHVGAFSLFANLLVLVVPLYMIQVFDRVLTSRSLDTLWVLTVGALIAFAVLAVLDVIRSRILVRLGQWLDARLAEGVAGNLAETRLPPGYRDPRRLRDLETLRGFLTGPAMLTLLDAPWVPVFVILIALLHPALGTLALLGAMALVGLALINAAVSRGPSADVQALSRQGTQLTDALHRQADAAAALGMGRSVGARWAALQGLSLARLGVVADRTGTILAVSRFLRLALQVGVMGLAASQVIAGELTPGAMVAAAVVLARALAPVEQSIGLWRQVAAARSAYLHLRLAVAETAKSEAVGDLPPPRGALTLNRVAWFPDGADAPLFAGLDLEVAPGRMLGVTGPTGGGKTALARLLVGRTRPHQGAVRLDGAELFSRPADRLGRHVGYVPQRADLFPGTVRDNIARFTDAPAAEVIEAARAAGVHETILALPKGYDTQVGQEENDLPGGLRQGIVVARALFGEPHLLVLDEPYTNLDSDGMDALIRALTTAKARGAVVVLIGHRPSLMAHCDRVLTLRDGTARLAERRQRAELRVLTNDIEESEQTPNTAPAKRAGGRS